MKDEEDSLSFSRSFSASTLRAGTAMTQSPDAVMKNPSSLSGVYTPEKSEEVASCSHTLLGHTEDDNEGRRELSYEKPFFLKISQIRPGFYRFNTVVRVVSCSISSFISLSSSFFPSSSSVGTSYFSSPSGHHHHDKKKNKNSEEGLGEMKEEEEEQEQEDVQTSAENLKKKKKKKLLSEALVEDETGMQIRLILRGEEQHTIAFQGRERGKWLLLRNASTSTVGSVLSLEVREEIGGKILEIFHPQEEDEDQDVGSDRISDARGEEKEEEQGEMIKEKENKKSGSSASFCLSSIPLVPLSRAL